MYWAHFVGSEHLNKYRHKALPEAICKQLETDAIIYGIRSKAWHIEDNRLLVPHFYAFDCNIVSYICTQYHRIFWFSDRKIVL